MEPIVKRLKKCFAPYLAKGGVFEPLKNPDYFVREMRLMRDGIGLIWPNEVDFSADGLRQDAQALGVSGDSIERKIGQAREVKTERFSRTEGKTPAFIEGEVQKLLGTVETSTHTGRAIALCSGSLPTLSPESAP
jgi:hypothetical protein